MAALLSKATVATTGLVCKAFLNLGYCSSVQVNGLENLIQALESDDRNHGRGVVTGEQRALLLKPASDDFSPVANHIST